MIFLYSITTIHSNANSPRFACAARSVVYAFAAACAACAAPTLRLRRPFRWDTVQVVKALLQQLRRRLQYRIVLFVVGGTHPPTPPDRPSDGAPAQRSAPDARDAREAHATESTSSPSTPRTTPTHAPEIRVRHNGDFSGSVMNAVRGLVLTALTQRNFRIELVAAAIVVAVAAWLRLADLGLGRTRPHNLHGTRF